MISSRSTQQKYRIGTVARLTGISPDTLRVWERRYGIVEPLRSPGGGREYSTSDVERLQLIKQLVDAGDAIGSIAGLETESLLARSRQSSHPAITRLAPQRPCRLIVAGEMLTAPLQAAADSLEGIELLAAGPTVEACLSGHTQQAADVLVVEVPTLHADTTRRVIGWLEDAGAPQALVVYRFAATEVLQRLPAARIQTVQAPVTPVVIRNLCLGMRPPVLETETVAAAEQAGISLSVSPRRYSNEMLSKLAQVSPTVKCECPKHLAELITDLVAFERYSAECENRNLEDAALHAYLHATASQARDLIETGLARVIELEGIELEE